MSIRRDSISHTCAPERNYARKNHSQTLHPQTLWKCVINHEVTTLTCLALSWPVFLSLHILFICLHRSVSQPLILTWSPADGWADCLRASVAAVQMVIGTFHSCRRLYYKAAAWMDQLQLDEQNIHWDPVTYTGKVYKKMQKDALQCVG